MAVMVMLYTTVLRTKMRNADGRSGHGGGEAEGQWIIQINIVEVCRMEVHSDPNVYPR